MERSRLINLRILFLTFSIIIIGLDILGIIQNGVMFFLAFIGIFSIIYGLTTLGYLNKIYSVLGKIREKISTSKKKSVKKKIIKSEKNSIEPLKMSKKKNLTEKKEKSIKKKSTLIPEKKISKKIAKAKE